MKTIKSKSGRKDVMCVCRKKRKGGMLMGNVDILLPK